MEILKYYMSSIESNISFTSTREVKLFTMVLIFLCENISFHKKKEFEFLFESGKMQYDLNDS